MPFPWAPSTLQTVCRGTLEAPRARPPHPPWCPSLGGDLPSPGPAGRPSLPGVCVRRPTVGPQQVVEVGPPRGSHPAPSAAPALREGSGEHAGQVGQQEAPHEVGVGEGARIRDKGHPVRGPADASHTAPQASEVAVSKRARLAVHPAGLGSKDPLLTSAGAERVRTSLGTRKRKALRFRPTRAWGARPARPPCACARLAAAPRICSGASLASLRLLTELESPVWWPFGSKLWKTPSETKAREGVSVKPSCEPLGKEGMLIQIPAIISHRTESHVKPGRLTVLVSGLEIYDSSSLLMHRFEREDVDDIKVHSPYEISIRQRFIGKPDMAYRLISAKMPEAIPILEVQFSKKMELLEDALVLRSVRTSSPAEKSRSVWHAASGLMGRALHRELPAGDQEGTALHLQMSPPALSEADTQELTQILRRMKGLALEAESELERQDEALDGVAAAVDRATLTIDKHNRRMKRLT
uniref:Synaptosome associated protein 47 n=1 Tax=Callithrix jacchus TaxID=9483 RepID=A0A8I3WCL7_CALJA